MPPSEVDFKLCFTAGQGLTLGSMIGKLLAVQHSQARSSAGLPGEAGPEAMLYSCPVVLACLGRAVFGALWLDKIAGYPSQDNC